MSCRNDSLFEICYEVRVFAVVSSTPPAFTITIIMVEKTRELQRLVLGSRIQRNGRKRGFGSGLFLG